LKPPKRVRVAVSVADIHRDPAHESELVTQALMGDLLQVLESADEDRWYRVGLPDGYRGWVRSWLVTPASRTWPGESIVEVDAPVAWIRSAPDDDSDPVSDVTIGSRLARRTGGRAGWVGVTLPDGRTGTMARRDLLGGGRPSGRRPLTVAAVLATARRFLGVPYVWGGRSAKGLDCSGLTQMVLALHGVAIPRDSRDQRSSLETNGNRILDPFEVPAGGLLFFGKNPQTASHVGFSLGEGAFLHAQGWVKIQSFDQRNKDYNKSLHDLFQVGCKVVNLPLKG
jgi:cell wall-associated NlpC family hydrolase